MGAARTAGHPADRDSSNLASEGALHPGRLEFSLGLNVMTSSSEQKPQHQQSQARRDVISRVSGTGTPLL